MKHIAFLFSFFALLAAPLFAQEEATATETVIDEKAVIGNSTLDKANDLYVQGAFSEAAKLYETALSEKGTSPELYYNVGNAYYKANEIGSAILNYERALRLSPQMEDAIFNLQLAQAKVIDRTDDVKPFFIKNWIDNFVKLLTSNQWFYVSAALFLLALIAALLFVFGASKSVRKSAFYVGFLLMLFTVTSFIFSGIRKKQFVQHNEAIIMSGLVVVKSSPDKSGNDLFQLHEGTKVKIKSQLGNWVEIQLGNDNVGWLEQSHLEKI